MKETTEAWVLGAQVTNGIYEIAEDGKVNLNDLETLIRVVLGAPKGVEGFGKIGPEQDAIGATEKIAIKNSVFGAMASVPPADRDDWTDAMMGILSVYRLGRRAGKKEVEQAILARLKAEGAQSVIASLEAA